MTYAASQAGADTVGGMTNETEEGWARCPQCGRRTRAVRMVAAPVHARHGQALECDTCEDDRRAARALFIPSDDGLAHD